MNARALETIAIDKLRPWPRNARIHSRKQIRQIAESIRRFGFTNPVLIDGDNRILAGHGRVEAARELGMTTAPCLRIDHLSAAEKRAYVLADNKLALNAGWDEELLALELQELMDADLGFDISVTGFSIAEVDRLIEGLAPEEEGDPADDRLPDPDAAPSRCRPATSGVSGRTGLSAATRWIAAWSPISWTAKKPRWSSPIRPITSRSTATSAGSAKSAIATSRWRREK